MIEPLHTQAMRRAMADVDKTGGWLETPELPADYGYIAGLNVPSRSPQPMAVAMPVLAGLRSWVLRTPDSIACADSRNSLSYVRLWREVARLARAIREVPGKPGPVAILLPADVRWPVALYACLAANRPAVALDSQFPDERNDAMIRQVGAPLIIASSASVESLSDRLGVPVLTAEIAEDPGNVEFPDDSSWLGQDEAAWIVATSGSTGQPKAVVHSQRSLLYKVCGWADPLHVGDNDRLLALSSPATITGLTSMLVPVRGTALELMALATAGFGGALRTLRNRSVTILRASASILRDIVDLPDAGEAARSIRGITTSGEQLVKADIERLGAVLPRARVLNTYGSTETAGTFWFPSADDDQDPVRVPAGVLSPGVQAMLQGSDGLPCRPEEPGELVIRCRYMAIGEWEDGRPIPGRMQPDHTDPTFRVYRTGDLARISPDGVFILLGRIDRQVKINGQFVDLAQIEALLRTAPNVARVAVVARERDNSARLLAFIEPAPEPPAELAASLRTLVRGSLPALMWPARLLVVRTLPSLPGGKVDETRLEENMGEIIQAA